MRLGSLVLQTQPWGEAAPTWRAIEASGVDTAYVAVLARMAATLPDVPGGRFVLGLGSGVPADVVADRRSEDPSVDSAEDRVARYRDVEEAGAAGFDELCFYWPTGEPGSRFWADPEVVAEGLRAARR